MIKTLKIALIWTILEPIWTILGIIFTILVLFLPYHFYRIYQKFDTKRTISVSSVSSLNKNLSINLSKRHRPFTGSCRSLLGIMEVQKGRTGSRV